MSHRKNLGLPDDVVVPKEFLPDRLTKGVGGGSHDFNVLYGIVALITMWKWLERALKVTASVFLI
jgi:hypothetical protein